MVRTFDELYDANEAIKFKITKKEAEIFKLQTTIAKNVELMDRAKILEDSTISAYVVACEFDASSRSGHLTTIRVIDTGEVFKYWAYTKAGTYIKITSKWLKQLRETVTMNEERKTSEGGF